MKDVNELVELLNEGGIEAYHIGQHRGGCLRPYCVVQFVGCSERGGGLRGASVIRVHILVPLGHADRLTDEYTRVRNALEPSAARGELRFAGGMGAQVTDDAYNAVKTHLDALILHKMSD